MSLLQKHRVIWSLQTNDRLTGSQNDHWMKGGAGIEREREREAEGERASEWEAVPPTSTQ